MADFFNILREYGLLLLIGQYPHGHLGGLANTLILSSVAMVCALPLGLLMAIARLSPWAWVRWPVTVWVYFMRGVPLLLLVFWVYFLVPLLVGSPVGGFAVMACTLALYQSSYLCEIIRGGVLALHAGQNEAARSLGLGYWRTLLWVTLPQALYNTLPSLISQFIYIVKETTIGHIINVEEMTSAAGQINNILLTKPFQVYFILAISYYLICLGLSQLATWGERCIERRRRGIVSASTPPVLPPLTSPKPESI